jgi:hypothetical protein
LALKHYGTNAKINGLKKPTDFVEPIEKNKFPRKIKEKEISNETKNIILTSKGVEIFIDEDKYPELSCYTWCVDMSGYAM